MAGRFDLKEGCHITWQSETPEEILHPFLSQSVVSDARLFQHERRSVFDQTTPLMLIRA